MPTLPWTPGPAAGSDSADAVVLASELRLRRLWDVPRFMLAALRIVQQTRQAPGAIGVTLRAAPLRRTFWTLSSWENGAAIDAFVRTEPHRSSMRAFRPAVAGTVFTTWPTPGAAQPGWAEAVRRLDEQRGATP